VISDNYNLGFETRSRQRMHVCMFCVVLCKLNIYNGPIHCARFLILLRVISRCSQQLDTAWRRMIEQRSIGNDLEGIGRRLIQVHPGVYLEGLRTQNSWYPSRDSSSYIWVKSVTGTPTRSIRLLPETVAILSP
jgi:hypothetical protein